MLDAFVVVKCVCPTCGEQSDRPIEKRYAQSPFARRQGEFLVKNCIGCSRGETSLYSGKPPKRWRRQDLERLARARTREEFEALLGKRVIPEELGRLSVTLLIGGANGLGRLS